MDVLNVSTPVLFSTKQDGGATLTGPRLTWSHLFTCIAVYFILYSSIVAFRQPRYPKSLPWVGQDGKGWLSKQLSSFTSAIYYRAWNQEGYEKYNRHDKSFLIPGPLGQRPEIILPRSQTQWLLAQPDDILNASEAHCESLHADFNFIDKHVTQFPYQERVLFRCLSRSLNELVPIIHDEVGLTVDEVLGKDSAEWNTINVWHTFAGVIPSLTNRMLIGLPDCRDRHYLKHAVAFTETVIRNMLILNVTPAAFKPILGRMLGAVGRYHWWQTSRTTIPVIEKRIYDLQRKDAGDPEYGKWTPPNDYITWHLKLAKSEGYTSEFDPSLLSKRIMPLNFAANHTTLLTLHSTLLNLLSSDPSKGYLEAIREECQRLYNEEGGHPTKEGLSRMYRTDSAIRESMRISTFSQTNVQRTVVAEAGITNEAEGWHAPKGVILSLNMHNVHFDEDIYENPHVYDAFRFSREREERESNDDGSEGAGDKEVGLIKQKALVTMTETHFPFGNGRHACPGRFFVASELKLLLSYLLRNYDFKPLSERPVNSWFGNNVVPAVGSTIEIKRKVGTS